MQIFACDVVFLFVYYRETEYDMMMMMSRDIYACGRKTCVGCFILKIL
jgi:hypothetical protein